MFCVLLHCFRTKQFDKYALFKILFQAVYILPIDTSWCFIGRVTNNDSTVTTKTALFTLYVTMIYSFFLSFFLLCLFFTLYPQRLLKSITPVPGGDSHRDFIVTNAVWPNPDQKKSATLPTWSALFWTYCKTTGQGGYLSPSLPLFVHLLHSFHPSCRNVNGVSWSQALVDMSSLVQIGSSCCFCFFSKFCRVSVVTFSFLSHLKGVTRVTRWPGFSSGHPALTVILYNKW